MRKSNFYIAFIFTFAMLWIVMGIHSRLGSPKHQPEKKLLVEMLQLSDLCLFTEARYTRHLSQSDLHSAFQDHPMGFEHFPSGSQILPPVVYARLKTRTFEGSP